MQKIRVFNLDGDDNIAHRQIWKGNPTNLMQLSEVRYRWALNLYEQMQFNFWIPEKIDVTQDVTDWVLLTEQERTAFKGILSYLTFLDSIQVCNLPHIKLPVTAPEIGLCLGTHVFQECVHSKSYQYMIDSIIPAEERQDVYYFWQKDSILKNRCDFIASIYQKYVDHPTDENYFVSLFANYLLEGLYFYNGLN